MRTLVGLVLFLIGDALTRAGAQAPPPAPADGLTLRGPAQVVSPGVVSTALTEVRITFSPDGARMLWGVIGWTGGPGGWEILESRKTDGGWSTPVAVGFDSPANEFDPSFAPDGSGVYFFSNRAGGLGGDDLYFAPFDRTRQRYGEARNLGATVNSAGDEWAPVVSPDGQRLVFSSDGRGGHGQHDVLVSARTAEGGWATAQNPDGLNGPDEDFDATFLHDGTSLVFASGRFDGQVSLWFAPAAGRGWGARSRLGPEVNGAEPDALSNGPSVSAAEPGWLYFSTHREGGQGRMDIYKVRYQR